jgi:outer membrane receptor protein involved in Fe transport
MSLGILDSLSATFSLNSQRDGNTRQSESVTDRIVSEQSDVNVFGYSGQASTHFGGNQLVVFGGEVYNEHIGASRFDTDPASGQVRQRRALYPNGSRYTTYGLFVEDTTFLLNGKIRMVLGGRVTNVRANTFADRDPFGVIDSSQSFSDVTFNSALTWNLSEHWRLHFLAGRGFRAPNLNDLGAVGLNSLGFEIPASEAAPFGALIGSSAGEDAVSTGKRAGTLSPERRYSFETGLTYDGDQVYARIQAFDSELYSPIVRRTLLFPETSTPASLGGIELIRNDPTEDQQAQGVVPLGSGLDPLALKAFVNDGRARYYGFEAQIRFRPTPGWTLESNYSFLVGRELNPNRNVRRLVPQNGSFSLHYTPGSKPFWLEFASRFAGPQERLSGGDITDARIGAARSRQDIARVFEGGLLAAWIGPGLNGTSGSDVFLPTGENLNEVQNRLLPVGSTINGVRVTSDSARVPLFTRTDGWFSADVRGGISVGETSTLYLGVSNIFDTNYRSHGTGIDTPGISAFAGIRWKF